MPEPVALPRPVPSPEPIPPPVPGPAPTPLLVPAPVPVPVEGVVALGGAADACAACAGGETLDGCTGGVTAGVGGVLAEVMEGAMGGIGGATGAATRVPVAGAMRTKFSLGPLSPLPPPPPPVGPSPPAPSRCGSSTSGSLAGTSMNSSKSKCASREIIHPCQRFCQLCCSRRGIPTGERYTALRVTSVPSA